jgi:hypothetical protein
MIDHSQRPSRARSGRISATRGWVSAGGSAGTSRPVNQLSTAATTKNRPPLMGPPLPGRVPRRAGGRAAPGHGAGREPPSSLAPAARARRAAVRAGESAGGRGLVRRSAPRGPVCRGRLPEPHDCLPAARALHRCRGCLSALPNRTRRPPGPRPLRGDSGALQDSFSPLSHRISLPGRRHARDVRAAGREGSAHRPHCLRTSRRTCPARPLLSSGRREDRAARGQTRAPPDQTPGPSRRPVDSPS